MVQPHTKSIPTKGACFFFSLLSINSNELRTAETFKNNLINSPMVLLLAEVKDMGRSRFENHTEFPYHVSARCINRDWFAANLDVIWEIMTRQLYFMKLAFNVRIHAFVLMSNHFHLIVRTPDANLSEAMRYFMRETSREITFISGRINQTYGSRYHRSLLSSPLYFQHAYKYVYRNPVEAKICKRVEDYPFSAIPGLLGEKWLEVPIMDDENWGSLAAREMTLTWLNSQPSQENWGHIRKALRRKSFTLPKVKGRISDLEYNAL